MLFDRSEEGDTRGLGLIGGAVVRFAPGLRGLDGPLKIPTWVGTGPARGGRTRCGERAGS